MGDVRFVPHYLRVRDAPDLAVAIRALDDDAVIAALAAATRAEDAYLANVLATEAQNRLRRARTITENLGEGVYAFNAAARVIYLNAAAEKLLGWKRQSVIGQDLRRIVHGDMSGEECPVLDVLRSGSARVEHDHVFLCADGGELRADVTASPILSEGDTVEGVVVVFRQASRREEAQRETADRERRILALFDNALDAMLLADDDGRYIEVNRAACELLGASRGTLLRIGVRDVLPAEQRGAFPELWNAFLKRGSVRDEIELERLDGERRRVEFSASANVFPGAHLSILREVGSFRRSEET